MEKNLFRKLVDLQEEIGDLKAKVAKYEDEAATLTEQVDLAVRDVASRILVDDNGQPVDGGVYWYSGQAIVRVNGAVAVIPIKTIDFDKLFPKTESED